MTTDHDHQDAEGEPASPTAALLQELALYGWRPGADDPDPRPLPEARRVAQAVADIFDALVATLAETRLEPDLEGLLWATVNIFHRALGRVEAALDDNETAQKRAQREQDGSEVNSEALERLVREGVTLLERRDAMEFFREAAADQYRLHAGAPWTPRSGSRLKRATLTAALIDSRDFLRARQRADVLTMVPRGPKVAFTGGAEANDHGLIWSVLDKVRAKHPDLVLMHGGGRVGAERIAQCWAEHRGVAAIAFTPDWTRHGRAAPFKRNDAMLSELPIGVIVFAGSGIQDNLADKARGLGLTVMDFRTARGV